MAPDPHAIIKPCCDFTGPQEGNILWPYLDNAEDPSVTVGRGHKLYTAKYAALIFGLDISIVQPQWDSLKRQKAGLRAEEYEGFTSLRLTPEKSQSLFEGDIFQHILNCRDYVPDFMTLPLEVQITCCDIDFNVKGGIRTFPKMLAAIEARDWAKVQQESDRPQLQARSQAVRELLQPLIV